jgi:hypothetical protein
LSPRHQGCGINGVRVLHVCAINCTSKSVTKIKLTCDGSMEIPNGGDEEELGKSDS